MIPDYDDILSRIPEPPLWWDAHGVPRWCEFHPTASSNTYAREVALLRIACQGCGREFDAEINWWEQSRHWNGDRMEPLSTPARLKELHYGDPPNVGCCPAGHTMNCIDLRILQFWSRERSKWERCPELEIELERLEDYFGDTITKF